MLEKRELRIVKKVRVLVHSDRFFLYRMQWSYVDGLMCQRKHLLISWEHFYFDLPESDRNILKLMPSLEIFSSRKP